MPFSITGTWTFRAYYDCSVSGTVNHNDYWLALNTGKTLDGLPLYSAADCISDTATPYGSTSHPFDPIQETTGLAKALYRLAIPTGKMLDGLPLYAAENDPCCDGGHITFDGGGGGDGDGGGESGPPIATCGCGLTYATPRTIYAVGSSGSTPDVYPMTYRGRFPHPTIGAAECDIWLGNFTVSSVVYGIKYIVCQSGFGCEVNVLITNATGETIVCYPRVNDYQCPPLYIEVASYFPGTCEPIIGAFSFTIVDTAP